MSIRNDQTTLVYQLGPPVEDSPATLLSNPSCARLFLAATGSDVTVGSETQLDEDAAGWGGGVGDTPWLHVVVP